MNRLNKKSLKWRHFWWYH